MCWGTVWLQSGNLHRIAAVFRRKGGKALQKDARWPLLTNFGATKEDCPSKGDIEFTMFCGHSKHRLDILEPMKAFIDMLCKKTRSLQILSSFKNADSVCACIHVITLSSFICYTVSRRNTLIDFIPSFRKKCFSDKKEVEEYFAFVKCTNNVATVKPGNYDHRRDWE